MCESGGPLNVESGCSLGEGSWRASSSIFPSVCKFFWMEVNLIRLWAWCTYFSLLHNFLISVLISGSKSWMYRNKVVTATWRLFSSLQPALFRKPIWFAGPDFNLAAWGDLKHSLTIYASVVQMSYLSHAKWRKVPTVFWTLHTPQRNDIHDLDSVLLDTIHVPM